MPPDYDEITSKIDAREILRYLNDLGIRNISGEVLKYFITDLKKYIKYDLSNKIEEDIKQGPERLHSASTFCSRLRSRSSNDVPVCFRGCHKTNTNNNMRYVYSAPNLPQNVGQIPSRRACSCIPVIRKEDNAVNSGTRKLTSSNNIIRIPLQKQSQKKCDPVSLYHYYLSMWQKYKANLPGENNWADLRWSVRQKMAGYSSNDNVKKVVPNPTKTCTRRNGEK